MRSETNKKASAKILRPFRKVGTCEITYFSFSLKSQGTMREGVKSCNQAKTDTKVIKEANKAKEGRVKAYQSGDYIGEKGSGLAIKQKLILKSLKKLTKQKKEE